MTLYLFDFNNYYNRIIKKFDTVSEYGEPLGSFTGINFIPNDSIRTEQIINYDGPDPDYIIVADISNKIVSRWYVVNSVRTRAGQYKIELYRDVIADWMDDIVKAPVFIEKAIASVDDTAIYNNENMGFNQIKTSETLLKDKSECAWIVGYLDSKYEATTISLPAESLTIDADYSSLQEYPYYKYNISYPLFIPQVISNNIFRFNFYNTGITSGNYVIGVNKNGDYTKPVFDVLPDAGAYGYYNSTASQKGFKVPFNILQSGSYVMGQTAKNLKDPIKAFDWSIYNPSSANFGDKYANLDLDTILDEHSKIIQAGNKYYKINVNISDSKSIKSEILKASALGASMTNIARQSSTVDIDTYVDPVFEYEITGTPIYFTFEEVVLNTYTINIPSESGRLHLTDAPYDMFIIPAGELKLNGTTKTIKEISFRLAAKLQVTMGNFLKDIQLLPYCPLYDYHFATNNDLTLSSLKENQVNLLKDNNNNIATCLIWIQDSTFTKYIQNYIPVPSNNIDFKIMNECDFYRLSSPNYASSFEFSVTKNNGVSSFRIDCQYKPVSPYVRVAPVFKNLYGPINNDARGLICNGDFSLPQISDAWINYQQQNKNYQEIFNRQIENMDINNNIARIQEKINVATGGLSAATTSGIFGKMATGGVVGATIGAIGGGLLSTAGGLADIKYNELLRSEARDMTQDQFGYQLGNIRALPNTLTKVSSFNPNNKIFPVLEYYTCTDIEKEALRNKIKYNGMTIMRIGTIGEFIREELSYIKGKLIRLEIDEDFHITNTIANELYQGVYI